MANSPRQNARQGYMGESYPLSWLTRLDRKQLKDALDSDGPSGEMGFNSFAELFGYSFPEVMGIAARSQVRDFEYSKTFALLFELDQNGYTVQDVQRALMEMGVAAATIIPNNIEAIVRHGMMLRQGREVRNRQPLYDRDGLQNSDVADCTCENCQLQRYQFSRSQSVDQARISHRPAALPRQSSSPQYNRARMNDLARHNQGHFNHDPSSRPLNVTELDTDSGVRYSSITGQHYNSDRHEDSINNVLEFPNTGPSQGEPLTTGSPLQSARSVNASSNYQRSTSVRSQLYYNNLDESSINTAAGSQSINSATGSRSINSAAGSLSINSDVERENNIQSPQPVTNGSKNASCDCDKCRLESDPNETKLFKLASDLDIPCVLNSVSSNASEISDTAQNRIAQYRSHSAVNNTRGSSDSDIVVPPSNSSADTSVNVATADTDKTCLEPIGPEINYVPIYDTHHECNCKDHHRMGIPICNNILPAHFLGDNPKYCRSCREFLSTLDSRGRNSNGGVAINDSKAKGDDGELRHSWHGENSNSASYRESTASLSDSQIFVNNSLNADVIYERQVGLSSRAIHTLSTGNESYRTNRARTDSETTDNSGQISNRARTDSETTDNSGQISNQGDNSHGQSPSQDKRKSVFITYSWNGYDQEHLQEILCLCRMLRESGIVVRMDMEAESFDGLLLNKVEWLDTMMANASYIVACISPSYHRDIQETNSVSTTMNQLNARYVYDQLRNEYYHNCAQNNRVIPVMFGHSGAVLEHVPSCMQSTLVYSYPQHVQAIVDHILRPPGHSLLEYISHL